MRIVANENFGALAFRFGLPASSGVILLRLSGADPDTDNARILEVLVGRSDWEGHFSVVTDDRVRMRSLPG